MNRPGDEPVAGLSDANGRYLSELGDELRRVGIGGSHRRRIVAEFADHLQCEPAAALGDPAAALGEPAALADQFADELGTSLARDAALRAFAALAVTGVLTGLRLFTLGPLRAASGHGAETLALLACLVAAQVAFAAGTLGLLRAAHVRRRPAIPRAEATVLGRRAAVGLMAGALTTLAVPLRATVTPHSAGPGWLVLGPMLAALLAIGLAAPSVVRAARLRPVCGGDGGDLMSDLGPVGAGWSGMTPTRIALGLAAALAIVIAAAGIIQSDPYDGILRGLFEGAACLAGFALLGRYLGLRR